MIESMVAITIGVVGLLGVLALLTQAVGANRSISDEFVATYLAAEGVEIVKNLIDKNYASNVGWNRGITKGAYELDYISDFNPGGQLAQHQISRDPTVRSTRPLRRNGTTGFYSYDPDDSLTAFRRTVQIREDPSELGSGVELGIVSVVEWQKRGGGTGEVLVEDHFFDWRIQQ